MKRSKGLRSGTRSLLRKHPRERGKLSLGGLLRRYEEGERVIITIEPSVQKGMPHRRYQGKVGIVNGIRGRSYIVKVEQGNKLKTLMIRPEHLQPFEH